MASSAHFNPASPLGPSNVGYMPSGVERFYSDMNRSMGMSQAYAANLESPRVRFLTEQVGRMLYGQNSSREMAGDSGRMIQNMVAAASAQGWLGGGKPQNLTAATHNLAGAGVSFFSSNGAAGVGAVPYGTVAGMGPVTMATANMMQQSVQRHFFDSATGAQRLMRTSGMGYDGLAGVMSVAGARGLFGQVGVERYGVEKRDEKGRLSRTMLDSAADDVKMLQARAEGFKKAGQMDLFSSTQHTIGELEAKIKAGQDTTTVALAPGTEARMTKVLEEGSQALASVVDVFGKKDWQELLRNLEAVSGMKASGSVSFGDLKNRFESVRKKIEANGLDVNSVMSDVVAASEGARQAAQARGQRGEVAAGIAGRAALAANSSMLGAARRNGNLNYDPLRATQELQLGISSTMSESVVGAGEVAALVNLGSLTGAQEREARTALDRFKNAQTVGERLAANDALTALTEKFGFRPGSLSNSYGHEKVLELGGQLMLDTAEGSNANLERQTARDNLRPLLGAAGANAFFDLADKHSINTLRTVESALASGDTARLESILGKGGAGNLQAQFGGEAGKARFKGALSLLSGGLVGAAGFMSEEDRKMEKANIAARELAEKYLGGAVRIADTGFMENFLGANGMIPQDVTDAQLAATLGADKKLGTKQGVIRMGQLTAAGFEGMSSDDRKALQSVLGHSDQEFKRFLEGKNVEESLSRIEKAGLTIGMDGTGGLTALTKKALSTAKEDHQDLFQISSALVSDPNFQRLNSDAQTKLLSSARDSVIGDGISHRMPDFQRQIEKYKKEAEMQAGGSGGSAKPGQYLGELTIISKDVATLAVRSANGSRFGNTD